MAIACKAMGWPKQSFATVYMLTRNIGRAMKPSELSRATRVFDRVSVANAQEILSSWQRPEGYQGAIENLAGEPLRGTG